MMSPNPSRQPHASRSRFTRLEPWRWPMWPTVSQALATRRHYASARMREVASAATSRNHYSFRLLSTAGGPQLHPSHQSLEKHARAPRHIRCWQGRYSIRAALELETPDADIIVDTPL